MTNNQLAKPGQPSSPNATQAGNPVHASSLVDTSGVTIDTSNPQNRNLLDNAAILAKKFGMQAKIVREADGRLYVDLLLGKYQNQPDYNKYHGDNVNIHNYKKDPFFNLNLSVEYDLGYPYGFVPLNGRQAPIQSLRFYADMLSDVPATKYQKEIDDEFRKARKDFAPTLAASKKSIANFEAANEKELALEKAYQYSKDYQVKPEFSDGVDYRCCVSMKGWKKGVTVER